MKSMTGFGTGKSQSEKANYEVTVRTVNGRFLEARFHIPREFLSIESDLKRELQNFIRRGTVDVFVVKKMKPGALQSRVLLNTELALEYKKSIEALSKKAKLKSQLSADALVRFPEVIKVEEAAEVDKAEIKALNKAFTAACKACLVEKNREGESLKKDIDGHLADLASKVEGIRGLRIEANSLLEERFKTRIKAKLEGMELDSQRLAQEVVLQLEKSDINEELTRLDEHLSAYKKITNDAQVEGKKLDFYTQELLREVNTIGSKSQVAKLTQLVVEAKTTIERLREQVQNIE